jgi:membrane protein DedA with SNARE-associated domain
VIDDWMAGTEWTVLTLIFAVGMLAFLESLLLVGLLIPGVALLSALVLLAVAAGISLRWLLLAGFVGALLGDGISFHIGYSTRQRIYHWGVFRNHPDWLRRSQQFFDRYGVMSIAFGRFIGPLRPLIPATAGACAMSPLRFWLVNLVSSVAWSLAYIAPLYWLGDELKGSQLSAWLALVVIVATAIALLISRYLLRRS